MDMFKQAVLGLCELCTLQGKCLLQDNSGWYIERGIGHKMNTMTSTESTR
jgi:hypothetical protein